MTPEELEQTNRKSLIDECRRIGLALVSFAAGFLLWHLGVPLWSDIADSLCGLDRPPYGHRYQNQLAAIDKVRGDTKMGIKWGLVCASVIVLPGQAWAGETYRPIPLEDLEALEDIGNAVRAVDDLSASFERNVAARKTQCMKAFGNTEFCKCIGADPGRRYFHGLRLNNGGHQGRPQVRSAFSRRQKAGRCHTRGARQVRERGQDMIDERR